MKRTFLVASSVAIISVLATMPLHGRGYGGGGGRGGGYGGGRGGGGFHGGEGGGGGHGGYGGFHGGEAGHGGGAGHGGFDGFHGGEEGRGRGEAGGAGAGRYDGGARRPGNFDEAGRRPGEAAGAGRGLDNQLFGAQGAGHGAAANGLNNLNGAGNHMQQWQQHQPYNNWYQGHGNWGNGQMANAASAYAHPWAGAGLGAATGVGAASLGAAGLATMAMPGWGMGASYYNSGYQPYYNPYNSDGGDYSAGYDYSQPVQVVQYSVPSQSSSSPDASATQTNAPTASDAALQHGEKARKAFRYEDYTNALNEANLALKQMPGDPGLHEFRALALFALGHYQPAAAAVHSILAVGPGWNWTTMIGLYGDDDATYTKQLRALESYVQANPDSSAARFLLAYHYLTCSHTDAAEKELKKVVELTPKDQVAAQLLTMISKQSEGSVATPPAVVGSSEKPMTASALVGDWTTRRDDGSTIQLKFTPDSKFTWTYTAGGKAQQFSGTAADANGLLALQRDDGNAMMAHVTTTDGGGFRFRLNGGPPNDPGLLFTH